MSKKTFKTLRKKTIVDPLDNTKMITVRRWKTLIDRPAYNVKKGDLTGLIDAQLIPYNDKDAWFEYNTIMYGNVHAADRTNLRDYAIVRGPDFDTKTALRISGDTIIGGNAIVGIGSDYEASFEEYVIKGHTKILDNAAIGMPKLITGNVTIRNNSVIGKMVEINGNIEIYDQAKIGDEVILRGTHIHIHENSKIGEKAYIFGELNADEDIEILPGARIQDGIVEFVGAIPPKKKALSELPKVKGLSFRSHSPNLTSEKSLTNHKKKPKVPSDKEFKENLSLVSKSQSPRDFWMEKVNTIKANINAYETDIVKIIKFPVMVDLTDVHTADMVFALTDVEVALNTERKDFIQAATQLERKFLIAESNARRIAGTKFTEDEIKKTQQARDLFSLACNEATSEHEKRKAFKQGFNRLEGIIAIPDQAIEAMRVKVGIAEIEM